MRAPRAPRLLVLIRPIKFLIYDVIVAVSVVDANVSYYYHFGGHCGAFYGLKPMKSENQIVVRCQAANQNQEAISVFVDGLLIELTALGKEIFFRVFCCHLL